MRTALDIEGPVLEELKILGKREGRSPGQVASRLLAEMMDGKNRHGNPPGKFHWVSRPMRALVDLADKEAVFAILDKKTSCSPDANSLVYGSFPLRGNLVPDAHLVTILRQPGVGVLYSADADFRKFDFLEVVNPFAG